MGGKNYRILRGGYRRREISPGITELTLSTTIVNRSRIGLYGEAWSRYVFEDFDAVILDLIRDRSEARPQVATQ
jgi:hypothetical protein